jgi:hypothetical protein
VNLSENSVELCVIAKFNQIKAKGQKQLKKEELSRKMPRSSSKKTAKKDFGMGIKRQLK